MNRRPSAAYCREQLKEAQAKRKEADDAVRYWRTELDAARIREADQRAAREAGIDLPEPGPLTPARCECSTFYSATAGCCDVCGYLLPGKEGM